MKSFLIVALIDGATKKLHIPARDLQHARVMASSIVEVSGGTLLVCIQVS